MNMHNDIRCVTESDPLTPLPTLCACTNLWILICTRTGAKMYWWKIQLTCQTNNLMPRIKIFQCGGALSFLSYTIWLMRQDLIDFLNNHFSILEMGSTNWILDQGFWDFFLKYLWFSFILNGYFISGWASLRSSFYNIQALWGGFWFDLFSVHNH